MDAHVSAFDALTAQVSELAQRCARLSDENARLQREVSALLADHEPVADTTPASQTVPSCHEPGLHRRTSSKHPLQGAVSRRTIGKAIGAAAVGVVGSAALVDLHSHSGLASVEAANDADASDAVLAADETTTASSSGGVISATLSTSGAVVAGANSSTGTGVLGSSKSGRGGQFSGALAQIRLSPGASSTHPKTGKTGDLYVDKTGRLWFCFKTSSRSGWKQIG